MQSPGGAGIKPAQVVVGALGDSETIVKEYLAGNLKSTGSVCHEHQHEGDC